MFSPARKARRTNPRLSAAGATDNIIAIHDTGLYRRFLPLIIHHPPHQLVQSITFAGVERSDDAGDGLRVAVATIASFVYVWPYTSTWEAAARMSPVMWVLFIGTNSLFVLFLLLTWRRHNWARWAVVFWCGHQIAALPPNSNVMHHC